MSTKPNILGLRSVLCSDQRHRFISISRKCSSSRRRVAVFFLCPRSNDPCLPLLLRQRTRSSQSAQSVFADVSSPPSGSDVIDGFPSSGHSLRVNAWRHAIPLTRNVFWLTLVFYATERDRTSALTVVQRRLVFWLPRMEFQTMPHSAPI